MILLWKASPPLPPFQRGQRFTYEITYDAVMQGHLCPRSLPFKKQGGSALVMRPHSSVPAEINQYQIPKHHKELCGLLQTSKSLSSSDPLRTSSTSFLKFP